MNHRITPTDLRWPIAPALDAIAIARCRQTGARYELEDTVLRGIGWAEDIGAEAAPLHAEIARLTAEKRVADEAAEAARIADELANPRPWRMSKDTLITRITDAGKLAAARTLYGSQNAANKFDFDQMGWCWNTNAKIRGFVAALGLDPDVILARDEFLS